MIVNVKLLEFPEEGEERVGRVIEILGHPGRFRRRRRGRHPQASPAAPVSARGGGAGRARAGAIGAAELAGRRDFRGIDIVTIDGETARDFDDAVWVDRCPTATTRCTSTSPT
jgi:ribonuclease R